MQDHSQGMTGSQEVPQMNVDHLELPKDALKSPFELG